MSFWTYVLKCADGSYYTGHTDDLERRVGEHQSGVIKGYTHNRRPVQLMWSQDFAARHEALAAELRIKDWSRAKKEALFRSDWAALSNAAKPPSRRSSRQDVSTSSTSARTERERGSPPAVRVEPASSVAEKRRRDTPPPIIVLVRPQLGENIGKAARAMLNFGMTDMRLVDPRDGWPNPAAGPAASGADIVLERARVFGSVADAIADCSAVYASTVRRRELVLPVLTPGAMAEAVAKSAEPSAILFGPERSGLETEEVALANAIVTVPVNPDFASLNLAQAVILLAYEWSKKSTLAVPPEKELEPPARHGEIEAMVRHLEQSLEEKGYFHPPSRTRATKNTLRTIFTKTGWSSREVKAVRGVIRALSEPGRRRG